jgi:hypothetical protein
VSRLRRIGWRAWRCLPPGASRRGSAYAGRGGRSSSPHPFPASRPLRQSPHHLRIPQHDQQVSRLQRVIGDRADLHLSARLLDRHEDDVALALAEEAGGDADVRGAFLGRGSGESDTAAFRFSTCLSTNLRDSVLVLSLTRRNCAERPTTRCE